MVAEENDILGFNFETKNNIIKVLGVGGGGGNAVGHMAECGIKDVDFIISNTDNQVLSESKVPVKIQLGVSLTQGLGAGNNPENGKNAATESLDDIRKVLVDGNVTKMLFITAGMGGGTGTGAAPVIAALSKEMGILTVAIVTIPFRFEGPKRVRQALVGLAELADKVDSLLIIDNEKIREIYGKMSASEAFTNADNILTMAVKGIAEIITVTGDINVDFADVKAVMTDSHVALMGTGKAEGENRAIKAVQMALDSPLLNNNDINGAKNVLVNISSGSEEATLDEIGLVNEYIQAKAGSNADLIWGATRDASLNSSICVTLIATGFNTREILNPYEVGGYVPKNTFADLDNPKPAFAPSVEQQSQPQETQENPVEKNNSQDITTEKKTTNAEDEIPDKVEVGTTEIDLGGDDNYDSQDSDSEEDDEDGAVMVAGNFRRIDFSAFRDEQIKEYEDTPAYQRKNVKLNIGAYKEGKYQKFQLGAE
jgi:cell division protein FtsZ